MITGENSQTKENVAGAIKAKRKTNGTPILIGVANPIDGVRDDEIIIRVEQEDSGNVPVVAALCIVAAEEMVKSLEIAIARARKAS